MAQKSNFQFQLDSTPIAEATGIVAGTLEGIESRIYVNAFINYGLDVLRTNFNKDFNLVALGNPGKYHHVFEWNTLKSGSPIPLYRLKKQGQGTSRELTYYFVQSRRNVPLPKSNKDFDASKLSKSHVFRWKAMIMELGSPVNIHAKAGKKLIIPDDTKAKGYYFANKVTIKNPGGQATTGAFSGFWLNWFGTTANDVVSKQIIPNIEKRIRIEAEAGMRTIRESSSVSSKNANFNIASYESAMKKQKTRMESSADKYLEGDESDDE